MTDDDVLAMLAKAKDALYIHLDGQELRSPRIREATRIAVERGWLDLGELVEGDQWSWYEARLTDSGRAAVASYLASSSS